jgi:3-methyladenine DNA glycosylase/8-oxoguanine DNA glycosylase
MERKIEKWRPFRSIATSYLFASAGDPDPAPATS